MSTACSRVCPALERKVKRECRSLTLARFDVDPAAMVLRDVADDRETKTGAAG